MLQDWCCCTVRLYCTRFLLLFIALSSERSKAQNESKIQKEKTKCESALLLLNIIQQFGAPVVGALHLGAELNVPLVIWREVLERAAVDRVVNTSTCKVRVLLELFHMEGGIAHKASVVAERLCVVHVVHVAHELLLRNRQLDHPAQLVEVAVNVRRGGEAARSAEYFKRLGVANDAISISDEAGDVFRGFKEAVVACSARPYLALALVRAAVSCFRSDELLHVFPRCALHGVGWHGAQAAGERERERERVMCV